MKKVHLPSFIRAQSLTLCASHFIPQPRVGYDLPLCCIMSANACAGRRGLVVWARTAPTLACRHSRQHPLTPALLLQAEARRSAARASCLALRLAA